MAERETAERLREGMFRRGVTTDGQPWIDCRGCGPLGYADNPTSHDPDCWVAALIADVAPAPQATGGEE